MRDVALTMRGPVHGTKDARKVAIDSSVGAVTETYDFIWFGTTAALHFGHAFLQGASPIAGTLASFATLGAWGNLDTLVNNPGIITINDLEHQRHGFSGLPSSNWRPDCPSPPYPAPSCRPAATRRPATLTGKRGRRRSTDPPPFPQRTTWTSLHDAKTNSTALDRMSLSGRFSDQPVPR
jgi:hypothetical protein